MATILVVEDNPATRELLREFLQGDGHTVLEASAGLEALTVAGVASPISSSWTSASRTPMASTSPGACGSSRARPPSPSSH